MTLAYDLNDHVALFSTASPGCAPPQYLKDTNAHDAASDAIIALPATTTPKFAPTYAAK